MTNEMRKKAYAIAEGETGEYGSRDATSGGPPVIWEVNHMDAYTVTNLLILHDAIEVEISKRTADSTVLHHNEIRRENE